MADKMLLKAKLSNAKKVAVGWVTGEAEGVKRWHIMLLLVAPFAVAYLLS